MVILILMLKTLEGDNIYNMLYKNLMVLSSVFKKKKPSVSSDGLCSIFCVILSPGIHVFLPKWACVATCGLNYNVI